MEISEKQRMRRALLAASAGNVVEWYDWSVYATFAIFFSSQFFPSDDPLAGLLSTFAVFSLGFIARPLGSVTLGRITDKLGRTTALTVTVSIVALASALIGLAPTSAQIGLWAAVWLVVMRLAQGLALGAETSAALTFLAESATTQRRGLFVSVYISTVTLGTLFGSIFGLVLTNMLTSEQMSSFGWRIPFLFGGVLGFAALIIRRQAVETLSKDHVPDPHPVRTLWSKHKRLVVETVLLGAAVSLPFFVLVTSFPSIVSLLGANSQAAFGANMAGLFTLGLLTLFFGGLTDKIGRRPVLLMGSVGFLVLTIPGALLLWDATQDWRVYLAAILLSVPLAALSGSVQASLLDRYPVALRGSAFGLVWALTMAVFGGTGPMIATFLALEGLTALMAVYFMAAFAVAAVVSFRMKETAFQPLPV